ncbi:hypothetical protein EV641_113123 [Rhodococcus sp. SMB37]|uniref:hypothetical protein n=1 Tax=Rhodococcus sp. SMB37 TaxID=2512213 RepID=UPI0010E42A8A|nr:hypothetical protein [Rhodococcus sp. SMB37]TCN50142.1 hypothetical protein EV641_113123 [Rhodococcus sp. SMB37]
MTGKSSEQYSEAPYSRAQHSEMRAWRRIADEVDRLDPDAGRMLHSALARHSAPLRIQVAGRAGVGREHVQRALTRLCGLPGAWEPVVVDAPGVPDPVLDADVMVYVLPARLDPTSVHPADRRFLETLDSRRVVVVVTVDRAVPGLTMPVFVQDDPNLETTITDRVAGAYCRRFEDFVRTVAGIAASPQARDVIEAALEDVAASGLSVSEPPVSEPPVSECPLRGTAVR